MLERYQKLELRKALSRRYDYPSACKELAFILRGLYTNAPKNLQALMFQDTLLAFQLLPEVQTSWGTSAANLLLQAAEATLPKQKRAMAVSEFKHAIVSYKRHCKTRQDKHDATQLPQDVLIHIFSFLDGRSLVSAGLVCWLWNSAASDNKLWRSQYTRLFNDIELYCAEEGKRQDPNSEKPTNTFKEEKNVDSSANISWKEAFRSKYVGKSSRSFASNRGYCCNCRSVIWLNDMKCSNLHGISKDGDAQWKVKPISPSEVVQFLLGDTHSGTSSSDSDSDSDEALLVQQMLPKLWAYPTRHLTHVWKMPSEG
ncbi:hypothetical protein AMTR_s00075p00154970 [Amborella trichopoda]|uniref:F-box domain-containing protein n=2 Tax=Amborella trichopoda TaxID=13333 RepID=W1PA89_AMBTC|nr:hypothetical protein AMTR_s00075p00154970 [Amborella trichopoda]